MLRLGRVAAHEAAVQHQRHQRPGLAFPGQPAGVFDGDQVLAERALNQIEDLDLADQNVVRTHRSMPAQLVDSGRALDPRALQHRAHVQAHPDGRSVPSACDDPLEERLAPRLLRQVVWLRVVQACEGHDLLRRHAVAAERELVAMPVVVRGFHFGSTSSVSAPLK